MNYTINYTHAFNRTSERWTGSFGQAKIFIIKCVEAGVADHIEIRDSRGNRVYQYPDREFSPASIIESLTRPLECSLDADVGNDPAPAVAAAQTPHNI